MSCKSLSCEVLTYKRHYEVIAAAAEAECGGPGVVRSINIDDGHIRWKSKVEGDVIGLAAASSKLIVSTSCGQVYCFGSSGVSEKGVVFEAQRADDKASSWQTPSCIETGGA